MLVLRRNRNFCSDQAGTIAGRDGALRRPPSCDQYQRSSQRDDPTDAARFSFCNPAAHSHDSLAMPELPKTYDPAAVEPKWYARWDEAGYFRADAHSSKPAVLDRHSAAEHHRRSDAGPCSQQHDPGHSGAPRADAGLRSALAAGNGSRRGRNADRGRKVAAQDGEENAPRSRPGGISPPRAGVAGQTWRHHHRTTQASRLFLRLVAAALHLR